MKLIFDTVTVFTRELRPIRREPFFVVFGLVQPLFFLALFGPLLGSAMGLDAGAALQWFVPGNLVMLGLFSTSTTGANLLEEMASGSHERLLVTPLSRSSLLIGRALKEIAPTIGQALLIMLVATPFGFRFSPLGAVLGLLILALFSVGLAALSYSLALAVKTQPWAFWFVQQTFLFPMMILSGMLLPVEMGPTWLKIASLANPLTHMVNAERALFAGNLLDPAVQSGLIAAALTATIGLLIGTHSMRRAA
jgi:ABC-2 type transport system permease protein